MILLAEAAAQGHVLLRQHPALPGPRMGLWLLCRHSVSEEYSADLKAKARDNASQGYILAPGGKRDVSSSSNNGDTSDEELFFQTRPQ